MVRVILTIDKEEFLKHKNEVGYFGENESYLHFELNETSECTVEKNTIRETYSDLDKKVDVTIEHDISDTEFMIQLTRLLLERVDKAKTLLETIAQ